jgi:hypothetical protein
MKPNNYANWTVEEELLLSGAQRFRSDEMKRKLEGKISIDETIEFKKLI